MIIMNKFCFYGNKAYIHYLVCNTHMNVKGKRLQFSLYVCIFNFAGIRQLKIIFSLEQFLLELILFLTKNKYQ